MKKTLIGITFLFTLASGLARAQSEEENSERVRGGADEIEGWIIKKTPKGIVKIPKKQKFKFEGSDLEADSGQPPSTVLQPRIAPDRRSLIPVRPTFQNEFLDSTGIEKRGSR
jgi:hypothetical protein